MRQFGVAHETLFMISNREKHGHLYQYVDCRLSKQFLAPGGLSAECIQISCM